MVRIPPAKWIALTAMVVLLAGCAGTRRPVEGEKVLRHKVAPDESLEDVAADYYGDAGRAKEIARFNDVDPDQVAPGQVLRVPMTPEEMSQLSRREQARAPYNDGLELVERGSYLDAILRFQRAVELDPKFAAAWYNLGLTHQRVGVFDRAIDEYRKAVKLRPKEAEYRYALGAAYFHEERYRDAVTTFEKTLEVDPWHRKAQYSLALSYERTEQRAKARAAWERYLELDSTSEWAGQAREHLEALE